MRHLAAALALVAISVPVQLLGQTPARSATVADPSVLTPGDSVRLVVWRKPELSGDFVIGPDGTITHPLLRSVQVAGVPFATAEANVRSFLARYEENPQFVMEPLLRVGVSGEVIRPQVFAVSPGTTIAETVARAGGPTQFAKRNAVHLLRMERGGRQQEVVVDLMQPEQANGPVRSGDLIVVERRTSFFKDILVPGLSIIGALASIAILIERNTK